MVRLRGPLPYQKPPLGSRLDWSAPISRGLAACLLLNEFGSPAVSNAAGSAASGPIGVPAGVAWRSGPLGPQLLFDQSHYLVAPTTIAARPATMEAWVWIPPGGAKGCVATLGDAAGTTGWSVGINSAAGNMTTTGTYVSVLYNQVRWIATGLHYVAGAMNQVVMAVDAAGHPTIWLNGGAGVYTDTGAPPRNPAPTLIVGQNSVGGGDNRGLNTAVAVVRSWNRVLTATEVAGLYAAPFQMFLPPIYRRYFVVAAGPTNALSGTATGSGSATATPTLPLALAGTAQGQGSSVGVLTFPLGLAGICSGQGSATATPTLPFPIGGTAAGSGAASATPTFPLSLAGTATGSGSASATITQSLALAGGALGTGAATAGPTFPLPLSGTALGTGSASGTATIPGGTTLAGTATGTGSATATPTFSLGIAGSATGQGTASGTLAGPQAIAGTATGQGTAQATPTFPLPLAGIATGTGSVTGTLPSGGTALAGTATGTGSAAAGLTFPLALGGGATGSGSALAVPTFPLPIAGTASGGGSASGTIGVANTPAHLTVWDADVTALALSDRDVTALTLRDTDLFAA